MCVFVRLSVSLYLSGEALYMMNTWWGRFLQLKRASHRRAGLLAHKKHESSWKHFSLSLSSFQSLSLSLSLAVVTAKRAFQVSEACMSGCHIYMQVATVSDRATSSLEGVISALWPPAWRLWQIQRLLLYVFLYCGFLNWMCLLTPFD